MSEKHFFTHFHLAFPGATESSIVSHNHSLVIAETMESMRKQVGVSYPQDD